MPVFENPALFIVKKAESIHLPWLKSIIKKNKTKHTKTKTKQKSYPYLHLTYITTLKQAHRKPQALLSFSWSSFLILLVTQTNPFSEKKEVTLKSFIVAILLLETSVISGRWKFSEKYHSLSPYIIKWSVIVNASRGKTNLKTTSFYFHSTCFPFFGSAWCTTASTPVASPFRAQPCSWSCWGQTLAPEQSPAEGHETQHWEMPAVPRDQMTAPGPQTTNCPSSALCISLKFYTQSDQCSRGK